mmetsp:Transcript_36076/g.107898  ORF Transcript_36076/g.107898 Transcript_36076/m.107898 type:complete len:88 (-) Transcript_36076:1696-1959(-)
MHAFTPQQLRGGQRYGNRTKIGNWQEELCLVDEKKKERDESHHGQFEEKIRQCTSPVSHHSTSLEDGPNRSLQVAVTDLDPTSPLTR